MFLFTLLSVMAYLVGSIPTALIYGKIVHGVDIREHGSGNAGATNSLRVLGKRAGILVLIMDILKGVFVISISRLFQIIEPNTLMIFGFLAVLGHILPVFANFKGGKGIATSLGVIMAIQPFVSLIVILVFVLVVYFTKYVSLGSLIGAFSFLVYGLIYHTENIIFLTATLALFLLLLFAHRENIVRLIKGQESKYPPKA